MPIDQYAYFENVSDEVQNFIDPRPAASKLGNYDVLPVLPGGTTLVNLGRVQILPGQYMKVPWGLWNMALTKQTWTRPITEAQWLERQAEAPVERCEYQQLLDAFGVLQAQYDALVASIPGGENPAPEVVEDVAPESVPDAEDTKSNPPRKTKKG